MAKKRRTTARQTALQVLCAVETEEAYDHIALNQHLSIPVWINVDRALATELVYGTLRRRLTIDWVLERSTFWGSTKKDACGTRNNTPDGDLSNHSFLGQHSGSCRLQ